MTSEDILKIRAAIQKEVEEARAVQRQIDSNLEKFDRLKTLHHEIDVLDKKLDRKGRQIDRMGKRLEKAMRGQHIPEVEKRIRERMSQIVREKDQIIQKLRECEREAASVMKDLPPPSFLKNKNL